MKVRTLNQVNDRTAGGHIYSAGEGAVSVIDDADEDMVALMRKLAAASQLEILDDADKGAEQKSEAKTEAKTTAKTAPAKKTISAGKGGESA